MGLPNLLNVPRTPQEWQQWSFDNAQDHILIIDAIQKTTGNVLSVTLTSGGSGYTSIPEVLLDPNGSGANFNVSIRGGVIQTITLINGGQGYQSAGFEFSGGGGSGATASITVSPYAALTNYQIDPINFQDPRDFIWKHAQLHTDMNGSLGLQSIDLSQFDINDTNKLQAWIYSNYQEHNNVHERLAI